MSSRNQQHAPLPNDGTKRAAKITTTPAFLYVVVLVMGAIGAMLRYALDLALPTNGFPIATLVINLIGCYIIYVVYQWLDRRVHIPHALARGIGVGLVGAFTTLSAFCTESLTMLQTGEYLLFTAYFLATVFGTFLASVAGWATCLLLGYSRLRRIQNRRIKHHLEMQQMQKDRGSTQKNESFESGCS